MKCSKITTTNLEKGSREQKQLNQKPIQILLYLPRIVNKLAMPHVHACPQGGTKEIFCTRFK